MKQQHSTQNRSQVAAYPVNRKEICPFLIRVFFIENDILQIKYFEEGRAAEKYDVVNVYAWKDSTLREIAQEVKSKLSLPRSVKNLRFHMSSIFQDPKYYKWVSKRLGTIYDQDIDDNEENQTLLSFSFMIGDYLEFQIKYDY